MQASGPTIASGCRSVVFRSCTWLAVGFDGVIKTRQLTATKRLGEAGILLPERRPCRALGNRRHHVFQVAVLRGGRPAKPGPAHVGAKFSKRVFRLPWVSYLAEDDDFVELPRLRTRKTGSEFCGFVEAKNGEEWINKYICIKNRY